VRARIFVAGHNGMVGSGVCKVLQNYEVDVITATRSELDLTNQSQVQDFFKAHLIDEVYLAAAKVGGISANQTYPAEFIYQNLMIQANIIHQAHKSGVNKLLLLGSSCIYPKMAQQPIHESELLKGLLEPTNEPYAVSKIAGIKLCESYNRQYGRDYRSIMPTNLYGPGDNFHPVNSHVVPALIRRFHEAKESNVPEVIVWGSGAPKREFLHVKDMAEASVFVMNLDSSTYRASTDPMLSHINVGTGTDCSIKELAEIVAKVVGFKGKVIWDTSMPDGAPRKLLDISLINTLGWTAKIGLEPGILDAYKWFLGNQCDVRG